MCSFKWLSYNTAMEINPLELIAEDLSSKKCMTCGRELPVPDRQSFCSMHCENVYRKASDLSILWCSYCGKKIKNPKNLFCSRRCKHNDKFRRRNTSLVWLHCEICDKPVSYYPKVRRGLTAKTCSRACARKRKYRKLGHYDSSFLDTDSELRAYFIGLFLADGCFNKHSGILIALTDKQIIDDLAYWIQYKNSTHVTVPEGHNPQYAIRLYGEFCDKFKKLGFLPGKKAHRLEIPSCISKKTFPHFLRGFTDGDGSFYMHRGKVHGEVVYYLNWKLVSIAKSFLENVLARLNEYKVIFTDCGVSCNKPSPSKHGTLPIYSINLGHVNSINIGEYIYKNATIGLKRKYRVYKTAKEMQLEIVSCKGKTCTHPGCNMPMRTNGLCQHHYTLKYNREHKEQIRKHNEQYRKNNLDKIKAYMENYYRENREELLEHAKIYRQNNYDAFLEKEHRYYTEVIKPKRAAEKAAKIGLQ